MGTATDQRNNRAEKTRQTRQRMRAAALRLFIEQGYAATSMPSIAAAAEVAVQTLYYTFGTKRALLSEVLDVTVAGDDEPIPTLQRPAITGALAEPDPAEQLRRQAAAAREILENVAPLLDVIRGAAGADPELAEMWDINVRQRVTVQEQLVAALVRKSPLRDGVDQATAVDIALALQSPEVYLLLTRDRGWSPQQWENYTATALIEQLLGTRARRARTR
jgi:AcrR family transcriptional regulator